MTATKGVIVYQLDVQKLSPDKADAFVNDVKQKIREKLDDQWHCVVVPVRQQGNRVFVHALTDNGLEEIKPIVLDHGKFLDSRKQDTKESVADYVKLMLGAPCFPMAESVKSAIEYYVDRAFEYDVNDKNRYVFEELNDCTVVEGGMLVASIFEEDDETK